MEFYVYINMLIMDVLLIVESFIDIVVKWGYLVIVIIDYVNV